MKGHVYKPNCKCGKGQRCKCGAKWGFMVDVGINPSTGKRKQKFKGGFSTKKEAEIAKDLFLAELHHGSGFVDPSKALFKDIAEEWMEYYSKQEEIKPGTIRIRKNAIVRLNDYLAFVKIKEITLKIYQKTLETFKEKGFSDSSLNIFHSTANMIFKYSMKMEYIKKSPAEFAKIPRSTRTVEDIEQRTEIPKHMEKEELKRFLEAAREHGLGCDYEFFLVLAYSGMRGGELLALKWSDISFEDNTISITKTLYNPTNNPPKYQLLTPKTKKSVRKLQMDATVMQVLKALKKRQMEFRIQNPTFYNGDFVTAIMGDRKHLGYPEVSKVLNLRMDRILKAANLSITFTPHSLRHTHTSLLAETGIGLESIMHRLGHGDDEITKLIYLHVTDPLKKEAAQRFSDLMSGLR